MKHTRQGLLIAAIGLAASITTVCHAQETEIPAQFIDNRVIATPTLENGRQLSFWTDTGGGWSAIKEEVVTEQGWPTESEEIDGSSFLFTAMPRWKAGFELPDGGFANYLKNRLVVAPPEFLGPEEATDGFLGGRWHAEKIMRWNYPEQSFSTLATISDVDISDYQQAPAPVKTRADGTYITAFPRVAIIVDGETIPVLFDTGATAGISRETQQSLGNETQAMGTSFMSARYFDQWRANHPDWEIIEAGDCYGERCADMIKVPAVEFVGAEVGPVWFSRRPDANFEQFMSRFMDQPVKGAVGGSLFQYFDLIMDYPAQTLYAKTPE